MTHISRRRVLQGAAATATTLGFPAILSARSPSSQIRVGVVGLRGRGRSHMRYLNQGGGRIVALCDVDQTVLDAAAGQFAKNGQKVDRIRDFRTLLDRSDIDVVGLATPNHWHALQTIWACEAGKDVYVEKPVSHNVWEGRQAVRAAARHRRIVQTGTQIRSSPSIQEALEWVQAGNLGRIELARGLCYKPRQSIGKVSGPQTVDKAVDYDLWTGPAPMKPLGRKNLHYDWHWVHDTGNGDLGNQGIHQMDISRWALGEPGLSKQVISIGGRFAYDDDGNTPNTQIVYHQFEQAPLIFEVRGLPSTLEAQASGWRDGMDDFMETRIGVIVHCEHGYLRIPSYTEAHAHDQDGQHILSWKGGGDALHYANFLEAVRNNRPQDLHAPLEEGHFSSALCHMGNISIACGQAAPPDEARKRFSDLPFGAEVLDRFHDHLKRNGVDLERTPAVVGKALDFDPQSERFVSDEVANSLLTRNYREPFVVPEIQA